MTVEIKKTKEVVIPGKIKEVTFKCDKCISGLRLVAKKFSFEIGIFAEGSQSDYWNPDEVIEFAEALIELANEVKNDS